MVVCQSWTPIFFVLVSFRWTGEPRRNCTSAVRVSLPSTVGHGDYPNNEQKASNEPHETDNETLSFVESFISCVLTSSMVMCALLFGTIYSRQGSPSHGGRKREVVCCGATFFLRFTKNEHRVGERSQRPKV